MAFQVPRTVVEFIDTPPVLVDERGATIEQGRDEPTKVTLELLCGRVVFSYEGEVA